MTGLEDCNETGGPAARELTVSHARSHDGCAVSGRGAAAASGPGGRGRRRALRRAAVGGRLAGAGGLVRGGHLGALLPP